MRKGRATKLWYESAEAGGGFGSRVKAAHFHHPAADVVTDFSLIFVSDLRLLPFPFPPKER
jgi:hypothetical protein